MRMYKAWTWVGAFGDGLMLCAASARVGPARAAWWAVWDGARLHERTFRRSGPVLATPERVHVDGVLDLVVEPGVPWAVRTGATWTRKRPARVHGTALGRAVDLPGLVDESAGRHARVVSWWWSAGAGVLTDGRTVTWNLVNGLHDGTAGTSIRPTSPAGTSTPNRLRRRAQAPNRLRRRAQASARSGSTGCRGTSRRSRSTGSTV